MSQKVSVWIPNSRLMVFFLYGKWLWVYFTRLYYREPYMFFLFSLFGWRNVLTVGKKCVQVPLHRSCQKKKLVRWPPHFFTFLHPCILYESYVKRNKLLTQNEKMGLHAHSTLKEEVSNTGSRVWIDFQHSTSSTSI